MAVVTSSPEDAAVATLDGGLSCSFPGGSMVAVASMPFGDTASMRGSSGRFGLSPTLPRSSVTSPHCSGGTSECSSESFTLGAGDDCAHVVVLFMMLHVVVDLDLVLGLRVKTIAFLLGLGNGDATCLHPPEALLWSPCIIDRASRRC